MKEKYFHTCHERTQNAQTFVEQNAERGNTNPEKGEIK